MERQTFERGKDYEVKALDEKGRCCGSKPVVYKTPIFHTFCCRCDRSHNAEGFQISSWAWIVDGDIARRRP